MSSGFRSPCNIHPRFEALEAQVLEFQARFLMQSYEICFGSGSLRCSRADAHVPAWTYQFPDYIGGSSSPVKSCFATVKNRYCDGSRIAFGLTLQSMHATPEHAQFQKQPSCPDSRLSTPESHPRYKDPYTVESEQGPLIARSCPSQREDQKSPLKCFAWDTEHILAS